MESEKGPSSHRDMILGGAILTLTFLFVALMPLIGPVAVILTPLPILYYCSRLDRGKGFAVLGGSYLLTCGVLALLGQAANLAVLFMIGFAGVLLSELLRRRLTVEKTVLLASLSLCCVVAGFVLYQAYRTGAAPWRVLELYVARIVEENIKLYSQLNISAEQIRIIRENAPEITGLLTAVFPGLALSGAAFTVWINLLAARLLFRRSGLPLAEFGDLAAWKAPERLVWVLIAAGILVMLPLDAVTVVGMNALILCGTIYLFQGLAIAAFFFRQKRVPAIFRGLFYALLLIQQYMLVIVIAFGLFDLWADFRKRIAGNPESPRADQSG